MSNHPITPLASAQINHDHLKVELVEPDAMPAVVRIVWPQAPTVATPANYPAVAGGDHTTHRRVRYRPGTVEGARQVNQP
jgi:hypothetical protein